MTLVDCLQSINKTVAAAAFLIAWERKVEDTIDAALQDAMLKDQDGELPLASLNEGRPLGGQVYGYLREMLRLGNLTPGSTVQTGTLAKHLGVSKTPLRDALIQLQAEGFVRILPQRGVVINTLTGNDLAEVLEVLGALESKALISAFPHLKSEHIQRMRNINEKLFELIPSGDRAFRQYNELNIAFHSVFINLCSNSLITDQVRILKERMYHFPDRDYGDAWRKMNAEEHRQVIDLIESGRARDAADFIRDVHWSFDMHKKHQLI